MTTRKSNRLRKRDPKFPNASGDHPRVAATSTKKSTADSSHSKEKKYRRSLLSFLREDEGIIELDTPRFRDFVEFKGRVYPLSDPRSINNPTQSTSEADRDRKGDGSAVCGRPNPQPSPVLPDDSSSGDWRRGRGHDLKDKSHLLISDYREPQATRDTDLPSRSTVFPSNVHPNSSTLLSRSGNFHTEPAHVDADIAFGEPEALLSSITHDTSNSPPRWWSAGTSSLDHFLASSMQSPLHKLTSSFRQENLGTSAQELNGDSGDSGANEGFSWTAGKIGACTLGVAATVGTVTWLVSRNYSSTVEGD